MESRGLSEEGGDGSENKEGSEGVGSGVGD